MTQMETGFDMRDVSPSDIRKLGRNGKNYPNRWRGGGCLYISYRIPELRFTIDLLRLPESGKMSNDLSPKNPQNEGFPVRLQGFLPRP
jgi:hypothetical protein